MALSEMNGIAGASKPKVNAARKSFRMLSKVGTPKWVSNNRSLAKENAKYRKEIQKLTRMVSEQSIRYRSLEISWLHRGEALSKIDLAAATLGNHFMKILDSLKEIRTACQKELNVPFRDGFKKDNLTHLRKSMPNVKLDSQSCNNKGQLVNPVNPMVSGMPITKPTIALKRLKMRQLQENRDPAPVNVPAADNDSVDDSSDENLGPIAEVSAGNEIEEHDETSNETSRSSPNNRSLVMRVAEVPLERLSISRLSGSHRRSSGILSGCILQGDDTLVINSSVQNERRDVSSNVMYQASAPRTPTQDSPRQHSNEGDLQKENCSVNQTNKSQIIFREVYKTPNKRPDSPTPLSNQRTSVGGRTSSVRKYSASNRAKSSGPPTPKNNMNKYSVFKPLIIALKDVGNCLQNGRLVGIDQLEEGKVKTGASAEQKQQPVGGRTHVSDITLIETPANDQTHLNFTAGIGTLEYTRTSIGEQSSIELHSPNSTQDDFQKRIAAEDPLEGPSWRFESGVTFRGSKRALTKRSYSDSPPPKEKSGKGLHEEKYDHAEEDENLRESISNHRVSVKQENLTMPEVENLCSVDEVDMDITDSVHMINLRNSNDLSFRPSLKKTSPTAEKTKAESNKMLCVSPRESRSDVDNSSDADWEPSQKKKIVQKKISRRKEPKRRTVKRLAPHRNSELKVNTERGSGSSGQKTSLPDKDLSRNSSGDADKTSADVKLTQAFVHLEILTPDQNNTDSSIQEVGRVRRKAAPTCFREMSLGKKLRRGDSFFQ